jgi:hypothetical protein
LPFLNERMPKRPFKEPSDPAGKALDLIEEARKNGAQELSLPNLKLSALPEAIGQLTQLRVLDLTSNQLSALPEAIGQLTQLERLFLELGELADRLRQRAFMKFISVCDASGIIECELFAGVYRRFGIQTVRYPVVEIVGKVVPFANGNGHTLQVQRVAKARSLTLAG